MSDIEKKKNNRKRKEKEKKKCLIFPLLGRFTLS